MKRTLDQQLQALQTKVVTALRTITRDTNQIDDTEPTSREHANSLQNRRLDLSEIDARLCDIADSIREAIRINKRFL